MTEALARMHERRLHIASHPLLFPALSLAARLGPLVTVPGLGHAVFGAELVREVLSSPDRFTKRGPGSLSDSLSAVIGTQALVNMDGTEHHALRATLQPLFAPAFAQDVVERAFAAPLRHAVARLTAGGTVDLVALAQVLTGAVAQALLGLTPALGTVEDDEAASLSLFRAATAFSASVALVRRPLRGRRLAVAQARFAALTDNARALYDVADARTLLGKLRGAGLDFGQARGVVALLLLAGTETTASVLPRMVALLIDGGRWNALHHEPAAWPAAIEDGIRLTAAVPLMTRSVASPTDLGGRRLGRGERVVVCLFHALRETGAAALPARSAPAPGAVRVSAFGHGPHACPGAALARREIGAALAALLAIGDLRIVRRRYATRSLLPAYRRLELRRTDGAG